MGSAPDPFIFFQVSSREAKDAFNFHQSISSSDEHIWPRNQEQIEQFCNDGELFGVRKASSGEYVGLCYVHLDKDHEWEFGGLTVLEAARGLQLGSVLTNFALAHTIANQRPWTYGQEIIAHVHEANQKPRNLLQRVGFQRIDTVTVPRENAPASMKRNADGNIVGDKFQFPRKSLGQLATWFDKEFNGTLGDGVTKAIFEVRPGGLDNLKEALREAMNELKPED
jgi:ribosomal protein S18 acetylase RimI-like enzyme